MLGSHWIARFWVILGCVQVEDDRSDRGVEENLA